jgi:hypothetical protein
MKTSESLIVGNLGGRGNTINFQMTATNFLSVVFGLGLKESRRPKKALSLRITASQLLRVNPGMDRSDKQHEQPYLCEEETASREGFACATTGHESGLS